MGKIATEGFASALGGKSTTTPNKCCTKSRAEELGCIVNGNYSSNQLVQESDLKKYVSYSLKGERTTDGEIYTFGYSYPNQHSYEWIGASLFVSPVEGNIDETLVFRFYKDNQQTNEQATTVPIMIPANFIFGATAQPGSYVIKVYKEDGSTFISDLKLSLVD